MERIPHTGMERRYGTKPNTDVTQIAPHRESFWLAMRSSEDWAQLPAKPDCASLGDQRKCLHWMRPAMLIGTFIYVLSGATQPILQYVSTNHGMHAANRNLSHCRNSSASIPMEASTSFSCIFSCRSLDASRSHRFTSTRRLVAKFQLYFTKKQVLHQWRIDIVEERGWNMPTVLHHPRICT